MAAFEQACLWAVGIAALCGVSPAFAGGFYLQEQSQKEIGRANSGGAAAADDPSTVQSNPAGMTRLPGLQLSGGGTLLFIGTQQDDLGSTRTLPGGGAPVAIGGSDGGNPFKPVVPVPSAYATYQVGERLWLGLGVSAPFGLALEYSPSYFGRYEALKTDLKTYNIQPSVAYAVNDWLSVGGGVDIQYAKVTLTNAAPNVAPGASDALVSVKGDDVSVGWNAGVLASLGAIRVGLHYRSGIKHDIRGQYRVNGLVGPLAGGNTRLPVVSAPLPLPDIATASLTAGLGAASRVMLTGRWYNWSVLRTIAITAEGRPPSLRPLSFRDSWSVALGGEHDVSDRLTLRAGAMFDRTPTRTAFTTARIPDGDRTWLAAGASYDLNDRMTLNLSYAHTFIAGAAWRHVGNFYGGTAAATTVVTRARTRGHVDMLSAAIAARF